MPIETAPVVGDWYRHLDKGQEFEVIAVDEDAGLVEVQHFDGDLEEYQLADWYDMPIEPTVPPENWSGPYDSLPVDDTDASDTGMSGDDWNAPLNELTDKRRR